jgi:hypothetical protein
MLFISDLDVVGQPGTAHTRGPHLLCPSSLLPSWEFRHLLVVVGPEALLGLTLDHMNLPRTCGS